MEVTDFIKTKPLEARIVDSRVSLPIDAQNRRPQNGHFGNHNAERGSDMRAAGTWRQHLIRLISCNQTRSIVMHRRRRSIALTFLLSLTLATIDICAAGTFSNDPGLAALASRMLTTLESVPFDGPLRHYRGYMFNVKDAAFATSYAKAITDVPASLRSKYSWIGTFQGVSGPNELIADGSRNIVYSEICMPHNCPDHTVYAFFDPASRVVWGVVNVDSKAYLFGIQSARQEALVQAVIGRTVAAYGNDASTFPLSGKALAIAKRAIIESDGDYVELFYKLNRAMMQ